MRLLTLMFAVLIAAPLHAERPSDKVQVPRTGPYLGVQPGMVDRAPGKTKLRSKGAIQLVSWVGFQMTTPGGRVFIQSTESPQYDIVPSAADEVVIELINSRLHSRNESRPLDTRVPNGGRVGHGKQRRGNKTRVTIKLRRSWVMTSDKRVTTSFSTSAPQRSQS